MHSHVYLPVALLIDFRDVPIIAASDPKLKVFRENMIMFSGKTQLPRSRGWLGVISVRKA